MLKWLVKIPKDKLLHYIVGSWLGLVGLINPWLGLGIVLAAAVGKEL